MHFHIHARSGDIRSRCRKGFSPHFIDSRILISRVPKHLRESYWAVGGGNSCFRGSSAGWIICTGRSLRRQSVHTICTDDLNRTATSKVRVSASSILMILSFNIFFSFFFFFFFGICGIDIRS